MTFTVADFQDLLRLLNEHPEWEAALRERLLPRELLDLPAVVRQIADQLVIVGQRLDQLAEAQTRTEQRLDQLAEAQAHTEQRLAVLTDRVDALTERVDALAERVDALAQRVDGLAQTTQQLAHTVGVLADKVGTLEGESLEARYRERAHTYFSGLAKRVRLLDTGRLADRLEDAIETGRLTEEERNEILLADVVLTARRREDDAEIYLLAEVSGGIGMRDVTRAARRAELLAKLGHAVIPVVAGRSIIPEASVAAREKEVKVHIDRSRDFEDEP